MKPKQLFFSLLLLSLCLAGCAGKNVNNDNVANRNKNGVQPTRVNYDTRRSTPGVTDINNPNPQVTDVRDHVDNTNPLNNRAGDQRSRMRVADQAATRIADLADVDTANVIATENNAYVAVKLANGARLTNHLENKISNAVKDTDKDIDHVYVSANPNFYQHMTTYGNDIRAGKPVAGFFTEFSHMVQRIFPDAK